MSKKKGRVLELEVYWQRDYTRHTRLVNAPEKIMGLKIEGIEIRDCTYHSGTKTERPFLKIKVRSNMPAPILLLRIAQALEGYLKVAPLEVKFTQTF